MDANWTKEPWFILADPDACGDWQISSAKGVVATVGLIADDARIVAVINAMAGVGDVEGFVADAKRTSPLSAFAQMTKLAADRGNELTTLRASHDRYEKALREIAEAYESGDLSDTNYRRMRIAREALAAIPPA